MRGHGEGSIYPETIHGQERWTVAFSLPDRNGRRVREVHRYRTEREARKALKQGPSTSVRSSVGAYLVGWLDDVAARRLRSSTLRRYRSIVDQHLVPALGRKRMESLSAADVDAYIADRLGEGAKPRTVQQEHAVLARCLHDAERRGDVPRNVARLASAPRVARVERPMLDAEQARTFLDAVREDRLWSLYVLCRRMGLRQGEALGLRWPDLDLPNRRLTVRTTLHQRNGHWFLEEPKSATSRRTLDLPPSVVAALRLQRLRQLRERVGNKRWNERDLVFTDAHGEPLDGTRVTREFQAWLVRLKLPKVTFHSLRHLAATSMLAEGVGLDEVKRILGHSTIAVTSNIYSHRVASASRQAADLIERAR